MLLTVEISLELAVNKELLVKNQVLHQVKIELDHNHQWMSRVKDNKTKDRKIIKIKRKVGILTSEATVIKKCLTQVVTDK